MNPPNDPAENQGEEAERNPQPEPNPNAADAQPERNRAPENAEPEANAEPDANPLDGGIDLDKIQKEINLLVRVSIQAKSVLLLLWSLQVDWEDRDGQIFPIYWLTGRAYGHPKRKEGEYVKTSVITAVDGITVLTVSGTVYRLGKVDPEFEDRRPNFDPTDPLKGLTIPDRKLP